jgi:hypothetical protein
MKAGMNMATNDNGNRTLICLVILVLAISLFLAGCTAQDDSTQTKAGILLPLSGEYEKEGNNILSGIMAEANESGGGIEYPGGLSEDTMYEYYGRDTAMVLEEALAGGADTIPEIREELDNNIITGYTGIKYFRDGSTAPPYYIIIKVENGTWVKDDEYSAKAMARISAVYGGALEFDPLLNDDHARLPLPHGIYD